MNMGMDWQDFADKVEWEGPEYVLTDMSPDDVPVKVRAPYKAAQRALEAFWMAVDTEAAAAGVEVSHPYV